MEFILNSIVLFLVGCLTDTIWVLYINNVTNKHKVAAANYSVLTGLFGFIWLEGMLVNKILVIFWLLGLWIGTRFAEDIELSIKRLIKKENPNGN